jgi:hypothetical protein
MTTLLTLFKKIIKLIMKELNILVLYIIKKVKTKSKNKSDDKVKSKEISPISHICHICHIRLIKKKKNYARTETLPSQERKLSRLGVL